MTGWNRLVRKRDFYAGGLMVLLGLLAVSKGTRYQLGTLMQIGPGFMPTALGALLVILGIVIAGSTSTLVDGEDEDILPKNSQWRGWACILFGPILFIVFGSFGGLIPAAFSCVFVSSLGDRDATLKSSLTLAFLVTVFGVGLFSFVLGIPMPIWTWGGP